MARDGGRARTRRILVLRATNSPASRNDEECLRARYDVRVFAVRLAPRWRLAVNMIALAAWLLPHVWRADGVFFRFADYYAALPAFFARLFRRKLWIVIGGYDANWWPEYGYGVYQQPFRARCVRYALRNATTLLPVDESLDEGLNAYAFDPPRRNGVRVNVPGLRTPVVTLHDGFDGAFWSPEPAVPKEPLVFTTASVPQGQPLAVRRRMATLKGVPLLIEVARRMPGYRFAVAGPDRAALPPEIDDVPPNMTFLGHLPLDELRQWYRRARVYAHPSLTEGLPASVAEGMLCECVPVGSSVNGIPRLVGETGLIVERPDVDAWVRAIEGAMRATTGPAARQRILGTFSRELRCARLREIIEGDAAR